MSLLQTQPWEVRLLLAAQEAFDSHPHSERVRTDRVLLDAAYKHCEEMTYEHSRTFYMASALLPKEKRRAVRALYAFCRVTDDIVDRSPHDEAVRLSDLNNWRQVIMGEYPNSEHPVYLAWTDTQVRFNIPHGYAQQLINGVARDLDQVRYERFEDLAEYSYGVASTVGLMAMHIVGFVGQSAIPYAVRLGVALQMTNILRDVGDDWRNGRLYLPQDEMAEFGLCEEDIAAGKVTPAWRAFMAHQIERNRLLYAESVPGIALLDPDGRFAIAAAARLYEAILTDIEAHDYNVFERRASLSAWGKMSRLPAIWLRSRRAGLKAIQPG